MGVRPIFICKVVAVADCREKDIYPVALCHRGDRWTQNIKDETEVSAVWPIKVEELKEMDDVFVSWMGIVT